MGSGTELAKAYVQIIPSAEGISGKLSQLLGGEAANAGNSAGSVLGKNLGSTIVKTLGALGIGAAIKDTLLKGADFEQSLGGVETLFADHADIVIENAKRAYETAGLSANAYMETVTGFSASLLQGLNGDTALAAGIADRAITDMADNANKMGTSMESLQNAYQGFAKQNYTMLDNLKLGYGGTKEEMERLIADAAAMTDVQEQLGITVDASSMSFDNIINAISVMQAEMGIAGATSAEAATTFTGSFNAMKAATENFMVTLTTGMGVGDSLITLFGTARTFIVDNLIPMVGTVLTSIGNLLIEYGSHMITDGADSIVNFISGISQKLPDLIPKAFELIVTLSDALISNFPKIISAGISLIGSLVQGIINSLPTLIVEGPRIINDFANAIYSALWQMISSGLEMIKSLAKGIWDNRYLILENAGAIFEAVINVFSLSNMFNLGKNLITKLKDGANSLGSALVDKVKNIASSALESIKNFDWVTAGKNIVQGIASGVTNVGYIIIQAVKDVAGNALAAIKKLLGIKSPSRVFRDEVGKMMGLGLAAGVDESTNAVTDAMRNLTDSTMGIAQADLNYSANINSATAVSVNNSVVDKLDKMEKTLGDMVGIWENGLDMNWDDRNLGRLVKSYA